MQTRVCSHLRHPNSLCYLLWTVYYRKSLLASAQDPYTCLAIKWGDVRYFFFHYCVVKLKCTQPCIVLEKSSPFSQQSETVCLVRSGSSCWRAHAHTRVYTQLQSMHDVFGRIPYAEVWKCECVFMQLMLIECVYLIFIWFVLALSLALKVLPYCCLSGHRYW